MLDLGADYDLGVDDYWFVTFTKWFDLEMKKKLTPRDLDGDPCFRKSASSRV